MHTLVKTLIGSSAALVGLLFIAAPAPQPEEPAHAGTGAPRVVPQGEMSVARAFVPVEGELSGSRMFTTATLLRTGEVLILGGYDDHIQPAASAWLIGNGEQAGNPIPPEHRWNLQQNDLTVLRDRYASLW